ncbi:MAG: Bifunctional hemolysin/adenylate cyclase [Pseudomonas delhiensis]|nr:MAG: Bifunctional hemolysin/adenylate cyclase [Pseudomonas delhiensis]
MKRGQDHLLGGLGRDTLDGGQGNDLLLGGEGNDALYGDYGNDTLIGGAGNDYLNGGDGSDIYRFDKGWGEDYINNYDTSSGKLDAIEFGEGIAASEFRVLRWNDDLLLLRKDSSDRITIQNYFYQDANSGYRLEEIRFADGTTWTVEQIKAWVIQSTSGNDTLYGYASDDSLTGGLGHDTLYGYGGNDTLFGNDGNDQLFGGDGNDVLDGGEGNDSLDGGYGDDTLLGGLGSDTLDGSEGNDLLLGGEGDDTLYGGTGNDTLIGGAGNDYLNGGDGSDTYRFEQGFGQDTISNYDTGPASIDQVVFGEGISADQLWFSRSGQDLNISVIGSMDQVTLSSWYSADSYHLDQFVSADGKTLLEGQVQNLVNAMASFGVPAGGESNLTPEQHQQLEVVVAANWK